MSEQGSGRAQAQTRMEIRQRQMPFELCSANHVADHGVLTDGHLGRQLEHNLTSWEREHKRTVVGSDTMFSVYGTSKLSSEHIRDIFVLFLLFVLVCVSNT